MGVFDFLKPGTETVEILFDRHFKIWNAGESAGFSRADAEEIIKLGAGHERGADEAPPPPLSGSASSGTQECARCGVQFTAGEAHECAKGGELDPAAFDAGFPSATPPKRERAKPVAKRGTKRRGR